MMRPSFVLANPVMPLLLISILTWSYCLASALNEPSDTTVHPLPSQTQSPEEVRGIGEPRKEADQMGSEINTTPAITTGQCQAILADGRIQTVVYTCAPTGYSAVVQYQKPGNDGVDHEANETAHTSTPTDRSGGKQQHSQTITEIVFRPTGESSRTTAVPEKQEIPSTSTIPPRVELTTKGRRKLEPIAAITPAHRLHGAPDKIELVQIRPSLPFRSAITRPGAAIPSGRGRNSRVSTETSMAEPSSTTAPTVRGRSRWNASSLRRPSQLPP